MRNWFAYRMRKPSTQATTIFTAALFGTTMTNYQFVFSPDAFLVTLACFANMPSM